MKDLVVDVLVVEADREEHISRHGITIDEVFEVLTSSSVFIQGKYDRLLIIGKTEQQRFLTIVVGKREEPRTYGLVTARPSRKEEKMLYMEFEI